MNAGMKITASGGTDGANIVLFWPDNLPENADALLADDPITLVENLRSEGKLIWFLCDGDGGYTVAIYVRSKVPEELLALCTDREEIPALVVRGRGWFGDMEYMFKSDSSFHEKYPGMIEQVEIPEGTYRAQVYRTHILDATYDAWMLDQAGTAATRFWRFHGNIAACAVVSVLATVITFFIVSWTVWFCILGTSAIFALCASIMTWSERYKRAARANAAFAQAYPSYVVRLE
jgi:hypothetical protein